MSTREVSHNRPAARSAPGAAGRKPTVKDGPFIEAKELVVAYSPGRSAGPGRYAPVNGLRMYYQVHGRGRPLILLHGALTTIEMSFGAVLPSLARDRRVIAVEQQAHGRTADIDRPLSQEQMADDTAQLLRQLGIVEADFLGYSMGGATALQIAVRHPGLVRKLAVVAGAYNNAAFDPEMARMMQDIDPMAAGWTEEVRLEFERVAPKPEQWSSTVTRVKQAFDPSRGLRGAQLRSIRADTLLVAGGADQVVCREHVEEISRLVPMARLEVCSGADHANVVGHAAPLIPAFLEAPVLKPRPGGEGRGARRAAGLSAGADMR
jgi:pimeloyl-ACP methyl ester carboxylesterase